MLSNNNCVMCVLNQIIRVCDFSGVEEEKKDLIFKKSLQKAGQIDYKRMTSPEFAEKIYDIFTKISGEEDPYKKLRKEQNDLVLEKIDFFRERINHSSDPLQTSAVYSLLGNIIDYGAVRLFDTNEIFGQYENIQLSINDYAEFRRRLRGGKKVLIIGDNAGEAVFDRLFIEEIKKCNPGVKIYYGVRSTPAINDILEEDARYIGLDKVAQVLETGSTFAGTVVSRTTKEFQEVYHSADMIIAKGQGNFETLEPEDKDILFIFKVKCEVVARQSSLELGSLIFAFNSTLKKATIPKSRK